MKGKKGTRKGERERERDRGGGGGSTGGRGESGGERTNPQFSLHFHILVLSEGRKM